MKTLTLRLKGGPGSGFFGHAGRPGFIGGSMSPDKGGGGISTGGTSTSGKKKLALPADMFDKLLNAGTSDIKYAAAHRDIDTMRQMLATADVSTPKRKANADLLRSLIGGDAPAAAITKPVEAPKAEVTAPHKPVSTIDELDALGVTDWTSFDVLARTDTGSDARRSALERRRNARENTARPISHARYDQIKESMSSYKGMSVVDLKRIIQQESRLDLGSMSGIDKTSLVNMILERKYSRPDMIAFSQKLFSDSVITVAPKAAKVDAKPVEAPQAPKIDTGAAFEAARVNARAAFDNVAKVREQYGMGSAQERQARDALQSANIAYNEARAAHLQAGGDVKAVAAKPTETVSAPRSHTVDQPDARQERLITSRAMRSRGIRVMPDEIMSDETFQQRGKDMKAGKVQELYKGKWQRPERTNRYDRVKRYEFTDREGNTYEVRASSTTTYVNVRNSRLRDPGKTTIS